MNLKIGDIIYSLDKYQGYTSLNLQNYGDRLMIIKDPTDYNDIAVTNLSRDVFGSDGTNWTGIPNSYVTEEIWNSPLFQIMREEE